MTTPSPGPASPGTPSPGTASTAGSSTARLRQATLPSPVGALRVVVSDVGIRAVLWPSDVDRIRGVDATPIDADDDPVTRCAVTQLTEYFAGDRTTFDVPLDVVGTEFQLAAWRALARIPYGETRTYREQAADIGRPTAVRAIGAANGRNPVSIIVPCHRVVGADGSLTGFAGGIEAKRFLLEHERSTGRAEPGSLFG